MFLAIKFQNFKWQNIIAALKNRENSQRKFIKSVKIVLAVEIVTKKTNAKTISCLTYAARTK